MTTQDDQRATAVPPGKTDRLRAWAARRLRAADRARTLFIEASFTEIGQYSLVMFGLALFVLVVNLAWLGASLLL
ncbi:hypothetical protein [Amycolatopsis kentuckyensis]|uniref:hypothetical protein n=1 Tax=Amycolatopsis kentuckyensis TaxID=218823 RepID=UPI0035640F98